VKLQFCGAARTVTGSSYLLDTGKYKILIDCGAFQGDEQSEQLNYEPFPFDPSTLDFVIVTHAHFDHTGRLPQLVKQGFTGKFISTSATKDLAELILLDSAHLQKEEYRRWITRAKEREEMEKPAQKEYGSEYSSKNISKFFDKDTPLSELSKYAKDERLSADAQGSSYEQKEPLYDEEEVNMTMSMFDLYDYGQSIMLGEGLEIRFRNSGHIIGSSSVEVWAVNAAGITRKIVFSGDLGQPGARIIKDPDYIREADYVVIESTYGNRLHRSKDETLLEFLAILKDAQKTNGNILIPTFAVERAQELLYELNLFIENRLLSGIQFFLDSPMAIKATAIFKKYPDLYDEDARRLIEKGDDPFSFPGLQMTSTPDESRRLIEKKGVVIMAGSGMCTGGRIVHHLANNISDPNAHVIFVGYQVKGTLGRRIVDGEARVRIKGYKYDVNAKIHTLGGFSAHADERDLKYWLRSFGSSPKIVFVTHGEESTAINFAHNVEEEMKVKTQVPKLNEIFELD
jgi:metallo-beta-lactamase family protein